MPFYKGTQRSLRQLAGFGRKNLRNTNGTTRAVALQCVLIAEETCRTLDENEERSIFACISNALYQRKARRILYLLSWLLYFSGTKREDMPWMFGKDEGADKQFPILEPGDPRIAAAQLLGPI